MPDSPDDPLLSFVRQLLPLLTVEADEIPEPGVTGPSYHVDLPIPEGAEYQFTLWLGGGEKQISARLISEPRTSEFWYMPFEEQDFHSGSELIEKYKDTVELLIRHKTRIVQKRGWLFNSFRCEYEADGAWKYVYAFGSARWIRAPQIEDSIKVYQSPPLLTAA